MIDLHMHTVFSDGQITDVSTVVNNCKVFSITDHNSIQACKYFADKVMDTRLIVGCEVTVDRAPDYLVYFPEEGYSMEVEAALKKIRVSEEDVIKSCYHKLGYSDWEKDIRRAFSQNQRVNNVRTRDLAAIIHLYKNDLVYDDGKFDFGDLKIARKERWAYAENEGNPIPEDYAFEIAKKYNGVIVLAHPIHTAIKRCPKDDTNARTVSQKLIALIDSYYSMGGKTVEWEFFSDEHIDKYGLSMEEIAEIRKIVTDKSETYGFSFTIGSDSHNMDNYDKAIAWLSENFEMIKNNMVDWI